jgi:GDP-L-fucose synthase
MMQRDARIFVAGHQGLAGAAIRRRLEHEGCRQLLLRSRAQLDLRDAMAVERFFATEQPEYVFLAAAKVGGIGANSAYPADFIRDNLQIEINVIDAAHRFGVKKLLFLGSSCIYPKLAPQPMREECLLTGLLEPTNEPYAIAKIAGLKMCAAYRKQYGFDAIALMPTNLYGPEDNFNPESSHVLPALLRRFHEARQADAAQVVVWGTGTPLREFMHVDDLAAAALHMMDTYSGDVAVNLGTGTEVSIRELATLIAHTVGYTGAIVFDGSKPDGAPRKLLDVSLAAQLGWQARIPLAEGLRETYRWYLANETRARR